LQPLFGFPVTFRKYLVLAGVTLFAATGDSLLSLGMKQVGSISLHHLPSVLLAVLNPWVALGIFLLLAFFASYTTALSWADLTYVLPATSLGYVLLALIAKFALHEHVSPLRWLGIALISAGVGFVAGGPALTTHQHHQSGSEPPSQAASVSERCKAATVSEMTHADSYQGMPSGMPQSSPRGPSL
jgi:drug/metabolite transporter (DMT)-like permease